ncbi:outer membrane lipoprotein carrier protein LolA [Luteolibacter sp. SL250]|uniref:LolA family protein n=1 Tax=Luteolibacter sp. SL250 TaxID=2995170 RepID=UPI00226F0DF6|nr:outer membrane lipoprotein carrier protein LolA [Luteolibacter sp. SL250]WAC17895.1 outer membrane lipoprotein carrier protein LolA [Luteolibacter sp. SL250]
MRAFIIQSLLVSAALAQDAVIDGWLERQATITSLDAGFTQQRKLPSLKEPVTTPGRISFAKPDKFRWQLGEPMQTLAVSDGITLTLIEESEKSARQISKDAPQAARFSLLSGKAFESKEAFYGSFEIIESRVTAGIHQFTLKPKDRRMRSNVPWVFIDIDPVKKELRAMELEMQDKSRVRTVFENPRFNTKLPDSFFKPDLTGYKVK